MPGAWRDEVDPELVETCLGLNDLQAGAGSPIGYWTDYIGLSLTEGFENWCIHRSLEEYSGATRAILGWVRSTGRALGRLRSSDLIHLDFHHRNLLRVDGHLSAVVDWEGIKPGDRAFDLVTFRLGFTHAVSPPGPRDRVWARARQLCPPADLEAYLAHMALRRLDWTIRHHSATEVDQLVTLIRELRSDLS